jgi:succinoglycan biosynthesis transport protein ExoP
MSEPSSTDSAVVRDVFKPQERGGRGGVSRFSSSDFSALQLFRRIWRHKYLILGVCVVLTLLAAVAVNQMTPMYRSSAEVLIDPRERSVVNAEEVLASLSGDQETVGSEVQIIKSRQLLQKLALSLNLLSDPEFNSKLRPKKWWHTREGWISLLPDAMRVNVRGWLDVAFPVAAVDDMSREERSARELSSVVGKLSGRLEVSSVKRSRVISIAFSSADPQKAMMLSNALADLYVVDQLEAKYEATRRATEWLNERLTDLREKVSASERLVEAFKKETGLVGETSSSVVAQQLTELNTQLILASAKRTEVEARYKRLREMIASSNVDSTAEVLGSSMIQNLREQEVTLLRRVGELSQEYGEKHPRMINLRAEIADLRGKIKGEIAKIIDNVRGEVEVAQVREQSLRRNLETVKAELADANSSAVRLRELQREAEANRLLLETFLNRSKETSVQQELQQADARIISEATLPPGPYAPRKKAIIAGAFMSALALGILLALVREMLQPGFVSSDEVEEKTGLVTLALIPRLPKLRQIYAPEDYIVRRPTSLYGEAVRTLKTGIMLSSVDRPVKVVLITSSIPGEGKTMTAISLARQAAMSGQRTLLIDADLRRPRIHRVFSGDRVPGLADLIAGHASLEDVIRSDPKTDLNIMYAGTNAPNPPEMFGSRAMRRIVDALRDAYDLVIIDSPPALAVSDATVLAGVADRIVFSIKWGHTPRETVLHALNRFERQIDVPIDTIISMVDTRKHSKYDYGDSYYYSSYVRKYYTS